MVFKMSCALECSESSLEKKKERIRKLKRKKKKEATRFGTRLKDICATAYKREIVYADARLL